MAFDPAAIPGCSGITDVPFTSGPEASKALLSTKRRTFVEPADFCRRTLQNPVVGRTFRVPAKTLTEAVFGFSRSVSKLGKACSANRNLLILLVAGARFELATFGL
jgi:hypothetical protein